jgi:type IV pilus assembly protein PilM
LSKGLLNPVRSLFSPPRPLWACEFTSRHLIVAGVDSSRKKIAGGLAAPLAPGALSGSLSERNIADPQAMMDIAKDTLRRAGAKGFEVSVVIPDDSCRIAFLAVDSLTGTDEDREAFVRWKLKKSVPFDVDSAQIAYRPLGSHRGGGGKGIDIVVALSPRSIVLEYEELLEMLDLHAGFVVPSTLAALNLLQVPQEDSMYVKVAPGAITTTVFREGQPRFYRRVDETSLYDAVYPTMLYYQDKLGGSALRSITVCGYDVDTATAIEDLQRRFGIAVNRAGPHRVEDIYKPALGAADLVYER